MASSPEILASQASLDEESRKPVGRPRSSMIWSYFLHDAATDKTICRQEMCAWSQKGRKTSNLRLHLVNHHRDAHAQLLADEEKQKAQTAITEAIGSAKKVSRGKRTPAWAVDSEEQTAANRALAAMIACSMSSVNIVENKAMELFCSRLNPRFTLPGRTKINKCIDELYSVMKNNMEKIIATGGPVTMAADGWSKKGNTESFFGVTVHLLSQTFERHAMSLSVRSFPHPHTGVRIRALLEQIMAEWKIEKSAVFITVTDNGSNMVAAIKEARQLLCEDAEEDAVAAAVDELEDHDESQLLDETLTYEALHADEAGADEEMPDSVEMSSRILAETEEFLAREEEHDRELADLQRQPCFNHLLSLAVGEFDSIEENSDLVKKAKRQVSRFNHSPKATSSLIQHCGLKLVGNVPTRWNSTYTMIERLVKVKDSFETVCKEQHWDGFSTTEWDQLEALKQLLEPFDTYTNLTSGQSYTTSDLYYAIVRELDGHLRAMLKKKAVAKSAQALLSALDARFAKFLDPRNANHNPLYVGSCLFHPYLRHMLSKEQQTSGANYVKSVYQRLHKADSAPAVSEAPLDAGSPKRPRFAHLSPQLATIRSSLVTKKADNSFDSELTRYLSVKFPKTNEHTDAALFWYNEGRQQFPLLGKVSMAFLGSVGSSVSVEQLFSVSGLKCSGRRNRLSGRRLEVETLLAKNRVYYETNV